MAEQPAPQTAHLLAYGHLRQGGEAQHLMAQHGARLVAAGLHLPGYRLHDSRQGHPFACAATSQDAIIVDLFAVPQAAWPTLDAYEEVESGLYYRQALRFQGRRCFIYLTNQDLRPYPIIAGGDWLARS